jgi:phage terminase small subunit
MPLLTDRQERFIEEYLIDQNASAAAARAGYTARNMAAQGNELMNHPEIRERIRAAMQDYLAELRASAVALMKKRVAAAFFDPIRLLKNGWEPMPVEEMDEETRALVEVRMVMRKSGRVVYVKQPDREKALRALERLHEKMEWLREKEADRLWKAGLCMSLEEIEALDGGGVEGSENFEKPQEMLGRREGTKSGFPEKDMVLSGSEDGACEVAGLREPEIRGQSTKSPIRPGDIVVRPQFPAAVAGGSLFEKRGEPMVLSGWAAGAGALADEKSEKTGEMLGREAALA